jgi:hypothetical protein
MLSRFFSYLLWLPLSTLSEYFKNIKIRQIMQRQK